jgi:hypothetical protein
MRCKFRHIAAAMTAVAIVVPAALADDDSFDVTVRKAPVVPDGTTAGAITDFVLTFVDRDPAVDGIGLPAGSTVEVTLPDDFVNTGAGGDNVIILQGWPQSPIVPFPYDIDIDGNHITLTLTADYLPGSDGEGGPGPKQVHLLLNGFVNPKPGWYDIPLEINTATGGSYSGLGTVRIIKKARPNANIVSFASGGGPPPPFNNPIYQDLLLGEDALLTRLFMWDAGSVPFVGVDLVPTANPKHYLFRQGKRTVGHAWIDPPSGAHDYALVTTGPSAEVVNPITMVPTAGLDTQLLPDPSVAGEYTITFKLNGGNVEEQFICVECEDGGGDDDDDDGDDDDSDSSDSDSSDSGSSDGGSDDSGSGDDD